jgi:hypothetical protein
LTTEPLVLGLQIVNPSLKGLAVGTPDRFHAGIIRSSGTRSCADDRRRTVQLELGRYQIHSFLGSQNQTAKALSANAIKLASQR